MPKPMAGWQFWIDRGGTFTDVVACRPDGEVVTAKLLSEDPTRSEDAAIAAIRLLSGCGDGALPLAEVRIGTTIATNALLERKGQPVLLMITRGFGDALTIGTQERPDIFARRIERRPPVHAETIEIDERVAADGTVMRALNAETVRAALTDAHARGLRAVAIVLMHGYRYPDHERALGKLAREIGFAQVSVSHEVGATIKLIGRGDTSVVDAYLSPVLRRYVEGLSAALGETPLFMQSNGGLADGRAFRGKDAILSGPAGGIVGMAATAREAGFDRVIGFDMGGTSTDVSLYAGRYERDPETRVAGARIATPMLRIHTVAAGGGSICRFDGGRLLVVPESAGAVPGPACYGRGGPLTITDCNLLLGKIISDRFPRLFGPNGDAPLDRAATEARFTDLCTEIERATGHAMMPEAAAEGLIAIAVADMAKAIRTVSVGRGHDATRFTLACFGGAGGQHACLVADALGIGTVMIHPLAGVLSAYGMGLADRRALRERTLAVAIDDHAALDAAAGALGAAAREALVGEGLDPAAIHVETRAHLRYAGTDHLIEVALAAAEAMRAEFEASHRARFGFVGETDLIVERLGAEAIAATPPIALPAPAALSAPPIDEVQTFMAGATHRTPVHDRAGIAPGDRIAGPAVIVDANATTVIEPGWQATADALGNLILSRHTALSTQAGEEAVDPVRLEIFSGLFMGLAEEMGAALQHSASSVNIRERLDFSCAIFDAAGNLIANAPHIPVHLGSMGESIRTILARRGGSADGRGIRPGDVYALNAPYDGGTHLPDITVIMPVFADACDEAPAFFVAARGHHADIGGISPGSMPPESRRIEDEGVVIDNLLLVDGGLFREMAVRELLGSGPHPSRAVDMNVADLKAQVAACMRGAEGLLRLCADRGRSVVSAYMLHVQAHAEAAVQLLLGRLEDGTFAYEMDSGAVIRVVVTIDAAARRATVDFAGTSEQQPDNFNAPRSVVRAAVLYVMRTLLNEVVPMNDGCLAPVTILIPEGSMLDPRFPAAVVAGNVEVSQAITDALFGALGALAGSQGTMNNFTFGDDAHQYYETIAGGSGAGSGFAGAPVVQTHMTNSRMTDPEVLETRFPVLVEEFSIRRGSGGPGAHRGGDGATRRIRFLAPMRASILANRRRVPPFGLAGGADGEPGANHVERADGRVEPLGSTASVDVAPGDVFVIETPGGGGYGPVSGRTPETSR